MLLIAVGLIIAALGFLLVLKIFKDPDWGILAIFFLLPYERIPTVEVVGFTLKLNHIVGAVVIAMWFLQLLKFKIKNLKFVTHPTNTFVWLLIVALVLSFSQAVGPIRSVIFFAQALFVMGLYGVIVNRVKRVEMVEKIAGVILISTWVVVLFAFYQFIGDYLGLPTGLDQGYAKIVLGFPRIQAFAKEPLYLANFLFIPLGVIAGYLLQEEKPLPKNALLLLPLIIFAILLTVSRGAYIGLMAFGVFMCLFFAKRIIQSRAFMLAAGALVGAVFILMLILTTLGPTITGKFIAQATARDVELSSESIFGRLRAFGQAVEVWQRSPIFGVGPGGFGPASGQEISTGYAIVNNEYLEILAELGLIGLIAYLLVIISMLAVFAKIMKLTRGSKGFLPNLLIGLTASLMAILAQYNFFSTFAIIHIWALMGLVVAVEAIMLKEIRLLKAR